MGAAVCGLVAVLLAAGVAAAGDSAAVPGLGPATVSPPWDLGLRVGAATITLLLVVADLFGLAAVGLGLFALRRGLLLPMRFVAFAGAGAATLFVLVPTLGSADHLSYLAYGRIAAAGDDPYVVDPLEWRDGTDPVAGAIQPPWEHTRSVYGPVATLLQAAVTIVGDGSLRLSVWGWQVLCAAAFLLVAWLLDRLVRDDPAARARVAVLWTLNPLLLRQLVLGAHVDVLALAAGVAAIALAARRPFPAGLLLGVAVGIKAPYALFGLAVLWGLRHQAPRVRLRHAGLGLLGAAIVLVPVHLWSGPETYDQLRQATRMVSFSTPWRLVADLVDPIFGRPQVRTVLGPIAALCGALLAVLLAPRLGRWPVPGVADARRPGPGADPVRPGGVSGAVAPAVTLDALRAAALLSMAWVLTTPYALPWYDAMMWAPLAVLAGSALDVALLARLAALSLAYVPGRVVGLTPEVERLTLGFRREVVPWLTLAALIAVIVWAVSGSGRSSRLWPRRPVPAPGHSPR